MGQYRKRPVVIEAMQFYGPTVALHDLDYAVKFDDWLVARQPADRPCRYVGSKLIIPTLEGDMEATVGDFIICGVRGELYPCKPEIFDATYEAVE